MACTDKSAVVYSTVDQVFSEPIFRHCETGGGPKVRGLFDTEEMKSTGVLNRLLEEASNPRADVFWSGDPVRAFTLINRDLVQPYHSPAAHTIRSQFKDRLGLWTGFAARARVLLVNTERVKPDSYPRSIMDLAAPQWKHNAAIANPLFGTTTMHFAALFAQWGTEEFTQFLDQLRKNQIIVAASNGDVKRLVATGEVAFGLTDTDDAQQAISTGAPVAIVYPDQMDMGTLVMPSVAVLLRGAPHPEAGKKLLDCLLSRDVEERMALKGAHMPLRPGVSVPGLRGIESLRAMETDYSLLATTLLEIEPQLRQWVALGEL